MDFSAAFLKRLEQEDAVVVSIVATQGSVPRETGTWMAVFADGLLGTIGGGRVEFEAIAEARSFEPYSEPHFEPYVKRYVLSTHLGQCCGGVMHLRYEKYSNKSIKNKDKYANSLANSALNTQPKLPLQNVALFGGGHVGKAIVNILKTLPMQVVWIDSRDEIFPAEFATDLDLTANVVCEHSAPVQAAVHDLAAGSHVLVMSFSHAEDLDIVATCLQRLRDKNDLPFIGLIGSKTKWASFRHRLENRGFTASELSKITCPIGLDRIHGKEPEVIAVSVAAQLLQIMPKCTAGTL